MKIVHFKPVFLLFLAFFIVIPIIQPVCAANETVSIAYEGSGGSYIGDMIFFSGKDTAGSVVLLKISGPGLPAEGVPVYDMNGKPGTGNRIDVDTNGSWKYLWYGSAVNGSDRLQTARYTFTAQDVAHPEKTAMTSILLKKAEFTLRVTPNPVVWGNYVELIGSAEQATGNVQIDVRDVGGKISHTFIAPVGADGYFDFGFHVDMIPGQYQVTIGNPSMRTSLSKTLVVLPTDQRSEPVIPSIAPVIPANPAESNTPSPDISPSLGLNRDGSISVISDPPNASVMLDSAIMGSTPIMLGEVSPGPHIVVVKAPGYLSYTVQVTVGDGEMVTLTPALVKSPSLSPLPPLTALIALIIVGGISLFLSVGRKQK